MKHFPFYGMLFYIILIKKGNDKNGEMCSTIILNLEFLINIRILKSSSISNSCEQNYEI